ncbi:hypothetical protein BO71DRAFT_418424 [Aspergillus ellipticus CBS 707.79]|uniref:DSBA-like thioredoxin domain-containing protein n=1 Tax=Aspergillus ellipticus CBS 707.79 TaxID=1448320 RepID=A0A319DE90_9EURO|nr:hypothetical protein BO71DRAFT_418424 [Aspergillus ellipticus CBS 707.79]
MEDRMIQKMGADKVPAAQAHLARLGLQDGIQFRLGGRIGNTLRAHQLIAFCEKEDEEKGSGVTNAVVEGMFRAHFEEERDIADVDTLVAIAGEAVPGLDLARVRDWLETGQGVQEIERLAAQAREEGLRGVPILAQVYFPVDFMLFSMKGSAPPA